MGVLAVEQWWASSRLTRRFIAFYCAWVLLGSICSWYNYCDVDGAAATRVVFIHTRSEHVRALGEVTIHDYTSRPQRCRFVGNVRLQATTERPRILQLSLVFRHVGLDERMRVRRRPEPIEHTVDSLFSQSVSVSIPLPAGDHEIELSFDRKDVQYMMSHMELVENSAAQQKIAIERRWVPFQRYGGVQLSLGSGWFPPLPTSDSEHASTATERQAYLLLTVSEPGDYDVVFPWIPTDASYEEPAILLDGRECPMEVTPGPEPAYCGMFRLHLEKQHVMCLRLKDKIVSPLSQWKSRDRRFLSFWIPWNLLEVSRRE